MAWSAAPEGPLLDASDSSLSLFVGGNTQQACTTSSESVLAYTFGGIRSPLSLTSGRACFTCVILDATEVSARDTELLRTSYIARIGVSQSNTDVCRLGEVRGSKGISVGYNSTGKKVESSKFEPYGEPFGPRDHITVLVDLTGTQIDSFTGAPVGRVSYAKNGVWQGPAHSTPLVGSSKEDALHPHLLLRNCQAAILVDQPYPIQGPAPSLPSQLAGPAPDESYEPWISAIQGGRGHAAQKQASHPSECELIVMVGLPGSGKTTWAQRLIQDNPEKRYVLLGPELALDQMRLLGLRKASHLDSQGTVDHSLVLDSYLGLASAVLRQLTARAAEVPRNYILDQTNLSSAKRAASVAPFLNAGFQVKAALAAPPIEWLHFMQEGSRHAWGNSRAMPEKTMAELMANYFEVPWPNRQEGFSDVLLVHTQQLRPPAKKLADGSEVAQDIMELAVEERLQLVEQQVVEPQRELARKWLEKHREQASKEEEKREQEQQQQKQQQQQQQQQQHITPQEPTPPGVPAQQPSFPPSPPIFPSSSPLPQQSLQPAFTPTASAPANGPTLFPPQPSNPPPTFTPTAPAPANGPTLFPPQPPIMPMPMAPTSNPTPPPFFQAQPPLQQQPPTSTFMPAGSFPLPAPQQPQLVHPQPPQHPQHPLLQPQFTFPQPQTFSQPQPPIPPPFSFPQPPLQPQVSLSPQPPQQTLLQATQPIPPAPPQNSFSFFPPW